MLGTITLQCPLTRIDYILDYNILTLPVKYSDNRSSTLFPHISDLKPKNQIVLVIAELYFKFYVRSSTSSRIIILVESNENIKLYLPLKHYVSVNQNGRH